MSIYYEQKFISPDPIYAEVKESLRSYFDSGVIDDMMFPKWTEHCMRRFKKSAYAIKETVLHIQDYTGNLPEDFKGVREAWACSTTWTQPIQMPNAYYYQTDCRIDNSEKICDPCIPYEEIIMDVAQQIACDPCKDAYRIMHKVTNHMVFSFTHSHLLTPGNMNARSYCENNCINRHASTPDSFDIRDCRMITNFCEGTVHLMYYADTTTEEGVQLIPENFYVEDYLRKYLIYKCYEQLFNTVTDESFNQVRIKLEMSNAQQAEAYILADIDLKKQTSFEKIRQIGVSYRLNNKYRLR